MKQEGRSENSDSNPGLGHNFPLITVSRLAHLASSRRLDGRGLKLIVYLRPVKRLRTSGTEQASVEATLLTYIREVLHPNLGSDNG